MGTVYTVPPIPPDERHTTWVPAGVLSIGVEHRLLDDAELAANYGGAQMEEIQANLKGSAVNDNGVSLHVKAVADDHEYLRFDLFEHEPHYHYIEPSGEKQTIVQFDSVAMGEMLPWALHQLRHRLNEMLAFAGGTELSARVDSEALEAGLRRVEELARSAQAELAAAGDRDGN
ncbi:MAG: hypothetical protein P8R42_27140 [Candidatus Binatia bacterium]|nr:hypothetical protein [Candidatus Binatia bacterium]